jgi:hypothetical protein
MNGAKVNQIKQSKERLGQLNYNNQGCLMKIVKYNSATDIIVEFQDKHMATVHTRWDHFKDGSVKNPYFKSIYGMGCMGDKIDFKQTKREYQAWHDILRRCYDVSYHELKPTYIHCEVCEEWLNYENFYTWITSQENYEKWKEDVHFNIDKDILFKNNHVYSPETCCLVPRNVNILFVKSDRQRGVYPIGVSEYYKDSGLYQARCHDQLLNKSIYLGAFNTPEMAFYAYKKYKEQLIKNVANIEYNRQTITKKCYTAMLNYKIEITD